MNPFPILLELLQSLIDCGEFIHIYKIFASLNCPITPFINHIPVDVLKLWEYTYIDLLVTLGCYSLTAHAVKHSALEEIRRINLNDTRLRISCGRCGKAKDP